MPTSPRSVPHGTRTLDGITVQITAHPGGGRHRRYSVHRVDTGTPLSIGADRFDHPPTTAELVALLDEHRGLWRCHCGHTLPLAGADLIGDHLRDCTAPAT